MRPPCSDRARSRSRPPSAHLNSADPLGQPGTARAGTSRVPLAHRKLGPSLRRPVFPASLQPSPCSGVLAPRSGPAGPRSRRAGSGPAQRRLRNPWWGALARYDERRSWMELGSALPGAVQSGEPRSSRRPHSRRGSAEENNATARSSGPGPSCPARLPAGPASGPPRGRCN